MIDFTSMYNVGVLRNLARHVADDLQKSLNEPNKFT